MKRASYREGVAWIAMNDEPGATTEETAGLISVALLADLFGATSERVAKDVMRYRDKNL